jgi:hypothetical protein
MSAESMRNSLDERAPNSPPPVPWQRPTTVSVDPELLRWRAEMLLDEMMLGGVDVAASAPTSTNHREATAAPRIVAGDGWMPDDADATSGGHASATVKQNGKYPHATTVAEAPIQPESRTEERRSDRPEAPTTAPHFSHPANAEPGKQAEPQKWLFSAEERYEQLARTQQSATPATNGADGDSHSLPGQIWMGDDTNGASPSTPSTNGAGHSESPTATHDAVRRVSTQYVGVMSTANMGARRSNLLPRMSAANVDVLQREIYTLQHELDTILPAGHESNKRARHLLEKAQTILQMDGMRSAEVEYYLQQVRTIFQRIRQTIDWSSLYRNRLTVYLSAWLMLAILVVLARYLYQAAMEEFAGFAFSLTTGSIVLQHLATVLTAFFAGALGGALGALINLQRQSHMAQGFIDRKFGLRGLILPLMGAVVGLLLYLPLGLLFFAFGLDPSQNLFFSTVPPLLAFLFGISQESLYGTRE